MNKNQSPNSDQVWDNSVSIKQWNQRIAQFFQIHSIPSEPPTIAQLYGPIKKIFIDQAHKVLPFVNDTRLWDAYIQHRATKVGVDADKIKSLYNILGHPNVPQSTFEYFLVLDYIDNVKPYKKYTSLVRQRKHKFTGFGNIFLVPAFFGDNAKKIMNKAMLEFAEEMAQNWRPPLDTKKVENFFEAFAYIDKDLDTEQWGHYFSGHKDRIVRQLKDAFLFEEKIKFVNNFKETYQKSKYLSNQDILKEFDEAACLSKFNNEEEFAQYICDIKFAYRTQVISKTLFLNHVSEEELVEQDVQEYYYREFAQKMNECYLKNKSTDVQNHIQACAEYLFEFYKAKLKERVDQFITQLNHYLSTGRYFEDVIKLGKQALREIERENIYHYLPENERLPIIEKLENKIATFELFNEQINDELDTISHNFIPIETGKSTVQSRIISLIDQSVARLAQSEILRKKSNQKWAKAALVSKLTSHQAIEKMYQVALETRVTYFSKFLPNQLDKLIPLTSDGEINELDRKGIHWVGYHRARRELIAKLSHIVISDKQKYKQVNPLLKLLGVTVTPVQRAHLKRMQRAFHLAVEIDIQVNTKEQAERFIQRLKENATLKKSYRWMLNNLPASNFKELFSLDRFMHNPIAKWEQMISEKMAGEKLHIATIFSEESHPGIDINIGLLDKLQEHLLSDDFHWLGLDEAYYDVADDDEEEYYEEEYTEHELDPEYFQQHQIEEPQIEEQDLDKYIKSLTDSSQHQHLINDLLEISDLNQRLLEISTIFHITIDENRYGEFNVKSLTQIQKKLQVLYVETVKALALRKITNGQSVPSDGCLPSTIEDQLKLEVFDQILEPAFKSEVINNLHEAEFGKELTDQLVQLVIQISNTPTPGEQEESL